jgi:hypothetical protein
MPSSTSVSNHRKHYLRLDRFTVLLLGCTLAILALLEGISRERFDSTSKAERREMSERKALLAVQDRVTLQPHIAVLGNSLMLEGVEVPLLRSKLNPRHEPIPYFVLGTFYYDWYFGLKRLFAEGIRPRYVLLGLSPNQLASSEIRGDFTAHYLVQQSDLLEIIKRTHMNATRASEFILAHYSEFYSTREITRGYVMSRVLPSVGQMFHEEATNFRDRTIDDSVLTSIAAERLSDLDILCRENGAHLIFVVPPTYQKGTKAIVRAGREMGVTVLAPVDEDEFGASDYQEDGIHMNEKGAQIFTSRLADSLSGILTEMDGRANASIER